MERGGELLAGRGETRAKVTLCLIPGMQALSSATFHNASDTWWSSANTATDIGPFNKTHYVIVLE